MSDFPPVPPGEDQMPSSVIAEMLQLNHGLVAAMQAAYIGWRFGLGAEVAMQQISDWLCLRRLLPRLDLLPRRESVRASDAMPLSCGAAENDKPCKCGFAMLDTTLGKMVPHVERRMHSDVDATHAHHCKPSDAAAHEPGVRATSRLLRMSEVEAIVCIKRTAIYQSVKEGRFPKPVKVRGTTLWVENDIHAFLHKLARDRPLATAVNASLDLFDSAANGGSVVNPAVINPAVIDRMIAALEAAIHEIETTLGQPLVVRPPHLPSPVKPVQE